VEAFFFALYFLGGLYAVIWNVGCCYAAADKVGLCNLRVGLLDAIVVMATGCENPRCWRCESRRGMMTATRYFCLYALE
jgi:hypothetical protein